MRSFAMFVLAAALGCAASCRDGKAPEGPRGPGGPTPLPFTPGGVPADDSLLARSLRLPKGQPVEVDGLPTRDIPDGIAANGPVMEAVQTAWPRDRRCQVYEGRALAILRIAACAFDLGTPEAARALADRFPGGRMRVLGPEARIEGSQLRFAQGPIFVVAEAGGTPEEAWPSLLYLGSGLGAALRDAGVGDLAVRFPEAGRVDDRPAFRPIAAFGFQGVDAAWTSRYDVGGRRMEGFYVIHGSMEDARQTFVRYEAAFRELGAEALDDAPVCGVRKAFDTVFAAFVAGRVVGGVHMAEDADAARQLCLELLSFVAQGGTG